MLSVLVCIVLFEIYNYLYYRWLVSFVSKKKYHYDVLDDSMYKYIMNLNTKELIAIIVSLFNDLNNNKVNLDQLLYDNMLKWGCYMLYGKSMWQITTSEMNKVHIMIKEIEEKLNITFDKGCNKKIYMMRFGNNLIVSYYKFSVYYIFTFLLKLTIYTILYIYGYSSFKSSNNIRYFYKNINTSNEYHIFIHGFGYGILPYINLINKLSEKKNIIFLILPNISNMEYHSYCDIIKQKTLFPDYDDICDDFNMLIEKFNINKINLISHSFGTVVSGILLKNSSIEKYINKLVLIEPVCFMEAGYKIYRYMYNTYDGRSELVSKIIDYLVYKDIYIRYVSQRFMYGPKFWIFDVNSIKKYKHYIILSENDQIVPTDKLTILFNNNNINFDVVKGARHGDLFIIPNYSEENKKILEYMDM